MLATHFQAVPSLCYSVEMHYCRKKGAISGVGIIRWERRWNDCCKVSRTSFERSSVAVLQGGEGREGVYWFPAGWSRLGSHTAKATLAWFKKAQISLAEHPAQSPNINPIESVWHNLKEWIHFQHYPRTVEGLKAAVHAAWNSLLQEVIDRHINKMPEHIEALLMAKGSHT